MSGEVDSVLGEEHRARLHIGHLDLSLIPNSRYLYPNLSLPLLPLHLRPPLAHQTRTQRPTGLQRFTLISLVGYG